MNSQKLLILSIVGALLIVGGAAAFVKFRQAPLPAATPETSQAAQIAIDEAMASCGPKDQCIVVDTQCSFCCHYAAINARNEVMFNQMFDETCKNYKGSYCECHDLSSYPACVNGKCQMVKWSENKNPRSKPAAPAPSVPAQTAVPIPAPVSPAAPETVTAPVKIKPEPKLTPQPEEESAEHDPFGEEDTVPETAPGDDLNAPLPETYPPAFSPEEDGVHVIQP